MPDQVAAYVVADKGGNLRIGIGDDTFECPPGTVVFGPWLADAETVLVHRGEIAHAGTVAADQIPVAPIGARPIVSTSNGTHVVGDPIEGDQPEPVEHTSRVEVVHEPTERKAEPSTEVTGDAAVDGDGGTSTGDDATPSGETESPSSAAPSGEGPSLDDLEAALRHDAGTGVEMTEVTGTVGGEATTIENDSSGHALPSADKPTKAAKATKSAAKRPAK